MQVHIVLFFSDLLGRQAFVHYANIMFFEHFGAAKALSVIRAF